MTRELERQVNVKMSQRLYVEAEKISEKLDVSVSEIFRRAVSEGLKSFDRARLPGSPSTAETDAE